MDSFVIYFNEVTDSLDIFYYFSSNNEINSNNDIISNQGIIPFINYIDLSTIFLLGLFTSLCAYTFCYKSKKTEPKYIIVQQELINDKIVSV